MELTDVPTLSNCDDLVAVGVEVCVDVVDVVMRSHCDDLVAVGVKVCVAVVIPSRCDDLVPQCVSTSSLSLLSYGSVYMSCEWSCLRLLLMGVCVGKRDDTSSKISLMLLSSMVDLSRSISSMSAIL